ncbi:hypothetical protein LVJ83_04245 [Uruburuella testudinis]|uniref:Uncharacterized protein n=1 Tax=Uruburuella testudinis TaxID=1282863 RepID=A0ABY4DVI9_9NEIS|nr:hypothetical protein [Uruburuella testudinis]UOO82680.1 hypothetical protein LVJ83_04245 [Uruburuella testudinis]
MIACSALPAYCADNTNRANLPFQTACFYFRPSETDFILFRRPSIL